MDSGKSASSKDSGYYTHSTNGQSSHSKKGSSGYSKQSLRPFHYEQLWLCCQCDLFGPGAMSLWNNQCPQCGKLRCDTCHVEPVKIWSGRGGTPVPSSRPRAKQTTTSATNHALQPLYSKSTCQNPQLAIQASTSVVGSAETLETNDSDTEFSICYIDPQFLVKNSFGRTMIAEEQNIAQNSVPSASLSPDSSEFLAIFTDASNESGASHTESGVDTSSNSSSDDDDDDETIVEDTWESLTIRNLNAGIFAACDQNVQLATILISEVHAILESWSYQGGRSHASGTSGGNGTNFSGTFGGDVAGNTSGVSSGQPAKRSLDGENTSDRPLKQQKTETSDGGLEISPTDGPTTFACHFFKKNPTRYNMWANKKYKNCRHPKIPKNDLRRIKDHFKNHRLSQCDRCYIIFKDKDSLIAHRQSPEPCEKGCSTLKEGIDEGQWDKIEKILKKAKNREVERWYDIWDVLFPNITKPPSPYNEPDGFDTTPSSNPEAVMTAIRSRVQTSIEQGILPRDDQLYQNIFTIIRQALNVGGDSSENTIQAATSNDVGTVEGASSSVIHSSHGSASIGNESDQFNFRSVLREPRTEHSQTDHWNLLCDSNEAFDTQTDIAIPEPASPPGDWIESLDDIQYQSTDPHPLIANFGQVASDEPPPSVSNYQREAKHNLLDAFVADNFDFDAFFEEDLDPPGFDFDHLDTINDFDINNIIEGGNTTLQGEAINDFSFLDTEYLERRDTEPIKDHNGRNRGLQGRCENNLGDESVC